MAVAGATPADPRRHGHVFDGLFVDGTGWRANDTGAC